MNRAEIIYAPYHKLHSGDDYSGIVIDLNPVYRNVSRHGGEIWAEGEKGKDFCFYFKLPT